MKSAYLLFWLLLIACFALIGYYFDIVYFDIAVVMALVLVIVLLIPASGKAYSSAKGMASNELKELEAAKTSHPEELVKEQIKWYGERAGEEFFVKGPKTVEPIEGIAKGLNSLIKSGKKLFKK